MALVNLTFEQRERILKCCWETENVDYLPGSPDLTSSEFSLWGALEVLLTPQNHVRCQS
jgi:hypothetical protein